MVPVSGTPIISHQLQLLRETGISKIVVCCGYQHQSIQRYLGDGSAFGITVSYAIETSPLGRGGALKNALRELGSQSEPVLALNGDILTHVNCRELIAAHVESAKMATLLAVPLRSPYGIVESAENGLATRFVEKPELPYWINGGIYVLNSEIEPLLPERGDHEDTTFPRLAAAGQLSVFQSRRWWHAIDTIKDLNEATAHIESLEFNNLSFAPSVPSLSFVKPSSPLVPPSPVAPPASHPSIGGPRNNISQGQQ